MSRFVVRFPQTAIGMFGLKRETKVTSAQLLVTYLSLFPCLTSASSPETVWVWSPRILGSDWLRGITWPQYWPLIGSDKGDMAHDNEFLVARLQQGDGKLILWRKNRRRLKTWRSMEEPWYDFNIQHVQYEGKNMVFSPELTKTVKTYLDFCGNKHNISDYFVEIR